MSDQKQPEFKSLQVETRFTQRAKRPGGIKREQAVERAETMIEESEPDLLAALDADLTQIVESFSTPKIAPANEVDNFNNGYTIACRIRDIGGSYGFDTMTEAADSFCTLLDRLTTTRAEKRKLPPAQIAEAIHCHVDALTLTRQPGYRNCRPDDADELITGLRNVVDACCPLDDTAPKELLKDIA